MKNQSFVRSISGNLAIAMNRFAGMKTTFAIGWGLGLGQLPDFYHFSAITGSCQLLPF